MDWSQLPPLNSLKAFSALAGSSSYAKASTTLNVTSAAVRQQVKALEKRLETSLVFRHGRGVELTAEGKMLARDLDHAFGAMLEGVRRMTGADNARPVQITTSPAFAVEWLMPRIIEFQQMHPEITLLLNPTADVMPLKPGGIDIAVRYCGRDRLDAEISPLLVSDMIVAGAPSLLGDCRRDELSTFMNTPWLQELNTNEVADWFKRTGFTLDRPLIISQMPGNLIMQAVRRGDGITYTARAFFEEDIAAGRITVLHSEPASGMYFIEVGPSAARPSVQKFLAWLKTKTQTVVAD